MKKNLLNALCISLLSLACLLGGCDEPEEVITPNFPEKISANVAAGEQFEFTINPNMQWTLKIPSAATTHFKFIKGASELYTLHGTAGEHTIVVAVSENEEFDNVRVCEIEMTMGEESHVVAVLTRGTKERVLNIYAAEFDATEAVFVTDEDNNFSYSTSPAESIEWMWSNEQWMQRLMVDANFRWSLGANTPEWLLINETSGKVGQTELFLRVNREKLPLESVECTIEFCDKSDRNGDGIINDADILSVRSYNTQMEGCKDICEVSLAAEAIFNAEGEYYQASSSSYSELLNGRIYSPRGAEIFAANKNSDGSYSTTGAEWILFSVGDFPSDAKDYGVWERSLQLDVEPTSESAVREGAIVALPKTVAETGGYNIADYVVCAITQEGVKSIDTNEAIVAYDQEMMKAYAANFESLEQGTWPWNGAWASIPYAYKLTYRDNNSGSEVIFNRPFASYNIYGYNGLTDGKYDVESCWVALEESVLTDEDGATIEGAYHFRSRLGTGEGEFENTMAGSNGGNRAIFVFYDENNTPYALVYFVLDPTFSPYSGVEGDVKFADPESANRGGASLTEIVQGDEYFSEEDDYMGTKQYLLTLTSKLQTVQLVVPEHTYSWSYKSWITTESENTSATITIEPDYLPTAPHDDIIAEGEYKGLVSFYSSMSSTAPALQLHVIYKAN